jgi:hypothetical protein
LFEYLLYKKETIDFRNSKFKKKNDFKTLLNNAKHRNIAKNFRFMSRILIRILKKSLKMCEVKHNYVSFSYIIYQIFMYDFADNYLTMMILLGF